MSNTVRDLSNQNNTSHKATELENQNFLADIKSNGLANVFEAKNVWEITSIATRKTKYIHGKQEYKTPARSQAFLLCSELVNSDGRIASYYLELGSKGYRGICCTNEQIAELVQACTGSKCSGRTVSRVNGRLERLGLIRIKSLPTGSKMLNSKGKWVSKRVNMIFLTPLARLILGIDLSYTAIPSPKSPSIVLRTEKPIRSIGVSQSSCGDNSNSETIIVCTSDKEGEKESSTCLPSNGHPASSKHKASTETQQKRGSRKKRAKIYSELRHKFLHELKSELGQTPETSEIYNLAERQTSQYFPPVVKTVFDWDFIIWTWTDRKWHLRRKMLRKRIIPGLSASVALLIPPDTSKLNDPETPETDRKRIAREIVIFKNHSAWQKKISGRIASGDYPGRAKKYASENAFMLDMYEAHLNSGRIPPNQLPVEIRELFTVLADMIGLE